MKFILAEKKEMTQQFKEDGTVVPVTRVVAGPCVITQSKTADKHGYAAIQIGFGMKKVISKPLAGHFKNLGKFRYAKEFKVSDEEAKKFSVGDKITAKTFQPGDIIKVSGTSKGKGFQGVVKRHGFHGSPASHGHKDQLRKSGSIGAGGVQHVMKGKRMAGRMGGEQVTVTNLEVIKVNPETNEIFIKGAVPGARNNLLLLSGNGDLVIDLVSAPAEVPVATVEVKTASPEPTTQPNESAEAVVAEPVEGAKTDKPEEK